MNWGKLFNSKRNKRAFYVLASIVVFVTTYMLVLPALTFDEDTAIEDPAVSNETLSQEQVNELENVPDPFTIEQEREEERSAADSQASEVTIEAADTHTDNKENTTDSSTVDSFDTQNDTDTLEVIENNTLEAPSEEEGSLSVSPDDKIPAVKEGDFYLFNYESDEISVFVKAPLEAFPEGTTMKVEPIEDEKVIDSVNAALESSKKKAKSVKAVDITFYDVEGNETKPKCDINVSLKTNLIKESENTEVVHIDENGKGTVVDQITQNTAEDEVVFESQDFSPYVIAETETISAQVITADGESYTIEVTYGPEAGIPEGAELVAREILSGTDEYQKYINLAKEAVTNSNGDSSLTAEDIANEKSDDNVELIEKDDISFARFFDVSILYEGKEIEPKSSVQVNIKYDDAIILGENELVKAIHFTSEGTDLISVDVIESEEGITEVTFEQDSFSVTGTVVQYLSSGWPTNGNYVIIVKPYNSNNYYAVKNDGEITSVKYNDNTAKVTFSDLTSLDQVEDYWWTKSDSNYNGWKYFQSGNYYLNPNNSSALSVNADSVARTTNGNLYNQTYGYGTTNNYLLVNENSLKIEGQGDNDSSNRAVVFFANNFEVDAVPEPTEDPTEIDLGAPGTGKTIKSNNDGTYQLALSVTGKSQAQDKKSTADVLVVFDTSGSMTSSRMSTAVSAMNQLADTLFANNTESNPDTVRMKLLTFSTVTRFRTNNSNPQYYPDFSWVSGTDGSSTFANQLRQLDDEGNGGTNWEDALQDALSVEMREDAAKYVIFVSDGNPTYRNTRGGENTYWGWQDWNDENSQRRSVFGVWGTGSDSNATTVSHCYEMAKDDAKAIVDAGINFYTIGVYGNVNRMNYLTAYAYSGNDSGTYPAGHYQTASDPESLKEAFAAIINDINKNFSYTDVEIDDGITALTATALVTGTVNNYEYKISYVDAVDNQVHTVDVAKNADGTISIPSVTYNVKNADGSTKSVTTASVTVKGASYNGEKVIWELDKSDNSNYKLENGWTYEVSFTVWPTQRAYDLIADLANGNITYASLTDEEKSSIDQASLTLKTNSEASVTYRQITTINGVDGTPSDPKTVGIDNPPGVPLEGSDLKIVKRWNDDLDPTQLLDLLTDHLNDEETDVDYTVTLDVVQDKGTSAEEHIHTADYPDGFVYKPNVTIIGEDGNKKVTAATWPEIDIAVSPGIMMSAANAHKHGFDTAVDEQGNPKYETIEFNGVTYYIIEKGHRYEITERSVDYHFEMMTDIDHLMIIDGVLKNVIFNEEGTEIQEISQNPGNLTELGATNSLKGGINLYKIVEDSEGNKLTPKNDVFTVKCSLVDKNGNPYIRDSETVGDDESNGIVYRVYASDADLATVYPGKVDTGRNRTKKIGVLDSSEFTVKLKAGWSIRFINVPADTRWSFEEIDIPSGYEIDIEGTEIVDGQVVPKTRGLTGIALTNTANDAQITNKMSSFESRLLKVETGTGTKDPETGEYTVEPVKLEGVKFVVKNNNEGDDFDKYLTIINDEFAWVNSIDDAKEFVTNNEGVISFGNLPLGKYLLIETETKDGYIPLSEEVNIEIAADGINYQVSSMSEPKKAAKVIVRDEAGGIVSIYSMIEIPNSAGTILPHTGGSGTSRFYILGSMLIAGSLMYEYGLRRNRKRKEVK